MYHKILVLHTLTVFLLSTIYLYYYLQYVLINFICNYTVIISCKIEN